jgi:hypothetical protein
MRRCFHMLACLPLLATTACTADAIAGPEVSPEPHTQATPQAAQQAAAAPETISISFRCRSGVPVGSGEPLIIVDGVPWGGTREALVALDMESVEVLTDAQLAHIYGNRTLSGIIIIKTRGGASRSPAKPVAGGDARH